MLSTFRNLRALALLVLTLPGLVLAGAPHLRLCLGDLIERGGCCAEVLDSDCCDLPVQAPGAANSLGCDTCCIAIDAGCTVAIASAPASDASPLATPFWFAPAQFALAPVAAAAATPLRAAAPLVRPPGRAPIPLRI